MQVSDETIIKSRTDNFREMRDGLFVIIKQGAMLVDMCVYRGIERATNDCGQEFDRPYSLYELTIVKRKPEFENCDSFMNYSYLTAQVSKNSTLTTNIANTTTAPKAHMPGLLSSSRVRTTSKHTEGAQALYPAASVVTDHQQPTQEQDTP